MDIKKIAVAIGLLAGATSLDAMETFEVPNGMDGMGNRILIKLLDSIKGSSVKVKTIIGMDHKHYLLKNNEYFFEIVKIYYDALDHNDLIEKGDFFKAKMKLNYLLAVAKKICDQKMETDVKAQIVKLKNGLYHMYSQWNCKTIDFEFPKPIGIAFHFNTLSHLGEVSRLDKAMIELRGKKTEKMIAEGRLAEVDVVLVGLAANNDEEAKRDISKIRKALLEVAQSGYDLIKK
ncbi:hypothetical protein FACS1894122_06800 [Alphaproteobacteria bacterium]|nr:hypothetical protein FACS1894122_06800 [Alphaproteobacteria bacterium]